MFLIHPRARAIINESRHSFERTVVDRHPAVHASSTPKTTNVSGDFIKSPLQFSQEIILPTCRICLENEGPEGDLIITGVCDCSGSIQSVHLSCLQQWIEISDATTCEICQATYKLEAKTPGYNICFCFDDIIPIFNCGCLLAVSVVLFCWWMLLVLIFDFYNL
jgi:hypothetical protein